MARKCKLPTSPAQRCQHRDAHGKLLGQMVSSTQRPDRELAAEPRSTAYLQLGRGRQHGWEGTEKFSVPCSVPKLANAGHIG